MKFIKNNKDLLIKYLSVIVSNILIYILISFYFRSMEHNFLIMCILSIVANTIIFNYKEKVKTNYWLDLLCCIVVGIVLNILIDSDLMYSTILFTMFFSNNVVFMRSRLEDKFIKRMIQYLMILFITILAMFISLTVRIYL